MYNPEHLLQILSKLHVSWAVPDSCMCGTCISGQSGRLGKIVRITISMITSKLNKFKITTQ